MVTAVTLSLALAFERAEQDVMARPPRRRDAPLLSPLMQWRIGFVLSCTRFLWTRHCRNRNPEEQSNGSRD
jgi:magnesium-transporting ATPase (P-type)